MRNSEVMQEILKTLKMINGHLEKLAGKEEVQIQSHFIGEPFEPIDIPLCTCIGNSSCDGHLCPVCKEKK